MSSRKYESGSSKRKKKQKVDELIQSQRGALDKFVVKEPISENLDANVSHVDVYDVNAVEVDNSNANIGSVDNVDANSSRADSFDNLDDNSENSDVDVFNGKDIFDPRCWDSLDSRMIDVLVVKGPKRDLSIEKGPKDKFSKRFFASCYTRVLSNGEKCDRDWLVYSKELDKVFCFCCKIFKKVVGRGQLSNEGCCDWSHISSRLREHETSLDHVRNMNTWYDLRLRFQKVQTIDKVVQMQIERKGSLEKGFSENYFNCKISC
ncbi:Zinc finger MYM-type protein 5 [Linum perenne]